MPRQKRSVHRTKNPPPLGVGSVNAGLSKNEDEAPVGINGMAADLVGLAGIIVCAIQSEMGVPMDMDNMAKMVSKFRADLLADVKRRMQNE